MAILKRPSGITKTILADYASIHPVAAKALGEMGGCYEKLGILGAPRIFGGLRFSPDGRQIAFIAGQSKGGVWVMQNFLPALRAAK